MFTVKRRGPICIVCHEQHSGKCRRVDGTLAYYQWHRKHRVVTVRTLREEGKLPSLQSERQQREREAAEFMEIIREAKHA